MDLPSSTPSSQGSPNGNRRIARAVSRSFEVDSAYSSARRKKLRVKFYICFEKLCVIPILSFHNKTESEELCCCCFAHPQLNFKSNKTSRSSLKSSKKENFIIEFSFQYIVPLHSRSKCSPLTLAWTTRIGYFLDEMKMENSS